MEAPKEEGAAVNEAGPAGAIQAIDSGSVHRICSGQVVLTLATAIKELVENSLDAHATSIEVRLKEYGSELVEVVDNGCGVEESNFQGLTLKHHTSKLRDFSDLTCVETFGFRGEALSSLCALSKLNIVTCHSTSSVGMRLEYDHNGSLVKQTPCARQHGSTVSLEGLFSTLPVRHKEYLRNVRREFTRMVQVLNAYCIISTGVRLTCTNQLGKGKKNIVVQTNGNETIKENITNIFGPKQVQSLLEFQQASASLEVCSELNINVPDCSRRLFDVSGYVSSSEHGQGRSSSDRQFLFINKRPCDLQKVSRTVNEMYHMYNRHQNPFVMLNIALAKESVDVNVTPDKRMIFLQEEKLLLAIIKSSLMKMFEPRSSLYQVNQAQTEVRLPGSQSSLTKFSRSPLKHQSSCPEFSSRKSITSRLAGLKRSYSSAFSRDTSESKQTSSISIDTKQRKLDSFITSKTSGDDTVAGHVDEPVTPSYNGSVFQSRDVAAKSTLQLSDPRVEESALPMSRKSADKDALRSPAVTSASDSQTSGFSSATESDLLSRSQDPSDLSSRSADPSDLASRSQGPSDGYEYRSRTREQEDDNVSIESLGSNDLTLTMECQPNAKRGSSLPASNPSGHKHSITSTQYSRPGDDGHSIRVEESDGDFHKVPPELHEVLTTSQKTDLEDQMPSHHSQQDVDPSGRCSAETDMKVTFTEFDEAENIRRKERTVQFSMATLKKSQAKGNGGSQRSIESRGFRAKITPTENQTAEDELKKEIRKESFSKMEILGQFNLGFIIVRLGQDLFIVDQHASDEKYNFEMLQRHTTIHSQKLIQPQNLELTAVNEGILMDNLEIFHKNGFDFIIDEEAPTTQRVKLVSMPVSKNWTFGKEDIEELIFMLNDSPGVMCRPSRVRQMFASRACRKSVMIGTALKQAEMRKLVCHMGEIEQPWNCPHGRPTMRHLINLAMLQD